MNTHASLPLGTSHPSLSASWSPASVCSFQDSGQGPSPPKTHPWWLLPACLSPTSEIIPYALPIHHVSNVFDIWGVNPSILESASLREEEEVQLKSRFCPSPATGTWVSVRLRPGSSSAEWRSYTPYLPHTSAGRTKPNWGKPYPTLGPKCLPRSVLSVNIWLGVAAVLSKHCADWKYC